MKDVIKPAVVLLLITAVAAAILGVVESVTREPIALQNAKIKADAMAKVLPVEGFESEEVAGEFPAMVTTEDGTVVSVVEASKAVKDGETVGYAVTVSPSGFGGAVKTMVGLDTEGTITGLEVLEHSETPGLGAKAKDPKSGFAEQFTGKTAPLAVSKDGGDIEAITSATITSRAVTAGANAAAIWFEENGGAN